MTITTQPYQNILSKKKIWLTSHRGMLGSAMFRLLKQENLNLLLTTRQELDLREQDAVFQWVEQNRPDLIFHIGAKVGGIQANRDFKGDFLYSNLMIQTNVIEAARRFGVEKLVFVASNCIYPNNINRPISEHALLTGPLDDNVRSYAIAKIAGVEMCMAYHQQFGCDFISVIPPNLYGPGDNYHPHNCHVIAGILRRAHEAKMTNQPLVIWGDGKARRELLYVDDLAKAMIQVMVSHSNENVYNVGCGHDFSIKEIALKIAEVVGFQGKLLFDETKPNGTMKKLLDNSRILSLGWNPQISEEDGLQRAYQDFLQRLEISDIERT